MRIDLHAHSSGISRCCRVPYSTVLDEARAVGLDGIALTNHYPKYYVTESYDSAAAFAKAYVDEYAEAAAYAKSIGMTVLFGVELTLEQYGGAHLLLYGVEPSFCLAHPEAYDYSLSTLRKLVGEQGGAMVQAHPYRRGKRLLDPTMLDGIELNCHPFYGKTWKEDLVPIAAQHGLILTCGGDYHADTYRCECATILPDNVRSGRELAAYLRTTDAIDLIVQEPNDRTVCHLSYTRGKGTTLTGTHERTPFDPAPLRDDTVRSGKE